MRDLITNADAYEQLRLDYDSDGSADDAWLAIFIPVISQAVALWLKDAWRLYVPAVDSNGAPVLDSDGNQVPALDSDGHPTPKPVVRGAVLIELESAYRFRGGEGKDNVVTSDAGYGYVLNKASTAILTPLRRSTVA